MESRIEMLKNDAGPIYWPGALWKHKGMISCLVGAAVFAAIIISLVMRPVYEAKTVITPASRSSEQAGPASMNVIASQFGISTPSSSNIWEIINLLKSDVLKEEMIRKHDLLPVLIDKNSMRGKSEEQRMWAGIRCLREASTVSFSQRENSIRISVTFRDPKTATDLLNCTLKELTEHMSGEARRVAEANRRYLEREVDRTGDPFIRTKIYSMIAQQIEASLLAEVKENFAFKVIDPPRVPDRKKGPKRGLIVMIAFAASLLLGIFLALGKELCTGRRA